MSSWEKEKARCARRATELIFEMEQAIAAKDLQRFMTAYDASFRYLRAVDRRILHRAFLAAMTGEEEQA